MDKGEVEGLGHEGQEDVAQMANGLGGLHGQLDALSRQQDDHDLDGVGVHWLGAEGKVEMGGVELLGAVGGDKAG